ncbi:MFS transporter [Chloroflexota bacterium]
MIKKRSRIFYGWWIVAALFVLSVYRSGFIGSSFTAVFNPIVEEFGWSYTQVSLASSLRGIEAGILAPVMGILVDRYGPKRMVFIGGIIIAAGMFLLGRTTSLLTFYTAFALISLGTSAGSITVAGVAISNWFNTKLGLATGIMACGVGFGGFMIPVTVGMVDNLGWRTAMVILSIAAILLFLPLSQVIRHKPEQYGYIPDGGSIDDKTAIKNRALKTEKPSIGISQILKNRPFWHIAFSYLTYHIIRNAIGTHIMPYLNTIGVSRSIASLVAMGLPVVSIVGRFGIGLLTVKTQKYNKWLIALFLLMDSISLLLFTSIDGSITILLIFILLNGLGWGGLVPMRAVILREHFSKNNFGTVLGFVVGIGMMGNLFGAPLAGFVYDTMGNYNIIWIIYAGLTLLGMVSIITIPDNTSDTATIPKNVS